MPRMRIRGSSHRTREDANVRPYSVHISPGGECSPSFTPPYFLIPTRAEIASEDPQALLIFSGYVLTHLALPERIHPLSSQRLYISFECDVRGRIVPTLCTRYWYPPTRGHVHARNDRRRRARLVPERAIFHRTLPRVNRRVSGAHHGRRAQLQAASFRAAPPTCTTLA